MSNHCRQLPLVRDGRTNKISWLNLPFVLLMSAAGILRGSVLMSALNATILEGLFSCLH
jgi:hypothetical protein